MDISYLRLGGAVIAVSVLIIAALQLRRLPRNRAGTLLIFSSGSLLLAVTLFPNLADLPSEVLSLDGKPAGRLITLLLLASGLTWLVLLWERRKVEQLSFRVDDGIRAMGVQGFFAAGPPSTIPTGAVWVVIPALNEAENLDALLPRIPPAIAGQPVVALVVDDGSWDDTAAVAVRSGALVAALGINCGGGTALKCGCDIALRFNPAVIVTMDGDGQHDPAQIEAVSSPVLENRADIVLGSRILGEHERTSLARSAGIRVFNALINLLMGLRITDCSSGFRAIKGSALRRLRLRQRQYHTAELIIEAAKHSLRIAEVPVTISRRFSGSSKKGGSPFYGMMFLRTILKSWMH